MVLLEEMYYVLKDKEPFNEEQYARKLSDLKTDLMVGNENK